MSCGMTASCQMAEQVYQEWKECETIFWQEATPGHANAPARPSAKHDFAMLPLLVHLLRHLAAVSRARGQPSRT